MKNLLLFFTASLALLMTSCNTSTSRDSDSYRNCCQQQATPETSTVDSVVDSNYTDTISSEVLNNLSE